MGWKEMSTTQLWGEPDDGVEVQRVKGDPLMERVWRFGGENGGNGWSEGESWEEAK